MSMSMSERELVAVVRITSVPVIGDDSALDVGADAAAYKSD